MIRRRSWLPYAVIALVLAVLLALAGLQRSPVRAYALGAPNQSQIVGLNRGETPICEGPIRLDQPIGAARVWAASVKPRSRIHVTVRRAGASSAEPGATLGSAETPVSSTPDPYTATLDHAVAAGQSIVVCVSTVSTPVALFGSPPAHGSILAHAGRRALPSEFSLVLYGARAQSPLGAFGTIAGRASLFRFSWVGPWTFWLLAVGLVAAVVAGGAAIAQAAAEDASDAPAEPSGEAAAAADRA